MQFIPAFIPPATKSATALWFVFYENKLLAKIRDNGDLIPRSRDLKEGKIFPIHEQYLGTLDGFQCFAAELPDTARVPDSFSLNGLRELFDRMGEDLIWIAGRANQLVQWNRSHQYCGACGNPTENTSEERAKICPGCGLINYPRISPAVIVAVLKDNQILLANNKRFKTGYYSVLAGFVEPGENLEECVQREVFEEVGITLKNIRYFGSQPWPFPNSLMVAFTAEYAAGEINVSRSEIADAAWFSADSLPSIPPGFTIARQLIDWYLQHHYP